MMGRDFTARMEVPMCSRAVCAVFFCLAVSGGQFAFAAGSEVPVRPIGQHAPAVPVAQQSPLLQSSIKAGDALQGMLLGRLNPLAPILVTSFVDLEDLDKSSPVGRLVPQQIAARLGQYGYTVLDARLGGSMRFAQLEGEFMLSRNPGRLNSGYDAQAVLTGTYSRTGNLTYLSVRVLQISDKAVLAAYEYALPRNEWDAARDVAGSDATWQNYAPRQQVFTGQPTGAAGWTDPAKMPQQKPLPAATRKK